MSEKVVWSADQPFWVLGSRGSCMQEPCVWRSAKVKLLGFEVCCLATNHCVQ